MIATLLAPYETIARGSRLVRRCVVDQASADIVADGGYWEEAEIDGNQAIARVRCSAATLARITGGLPVTVLDDPTAVWTPTRTKAINRGGEIAWDSGQTLPTKSLAQLTRDVLTDEQSADLVAQAEALMARVAQEGYVRLRGFDWPEAVKLLGYLARQGYGLDTVSTGTFPTQGIRDNFNRADTGPPPSGSWDYPIDNNGAAGLKVIANQCGNNVSGYANSYMTGTVGPDSEVYVTNITAIASTVSVDLFLRIVSPGTGGTGNAGVDGYECGFYNNAGTFEAYHWRIDNNAYTQLGATQTPGAVSAGDSVGAEMIGSTLQAYLKTTSWAAYGTSRSDSTYSAAGVTGVQIASDTAFRFDDFGGGTVAVGGALAGPLVGGAALKSLVNAGLVN